MNRVTVVAAVLLILLAAADWWAVGILIYVRHRRPDVVEVRNQGIRFTFAALAASAAAILSGAYLAHYQVPSGLGLALLLAGLLLPSMACLYFLVTYYRR